VTEPAPELGPDPGPDEGPLLGVRRGALAPSRVSRLLAVLARHWWVYRSTIVANALPAFLEPILFLTAVGLGLGGYVEGGVNGLPLAAFMGPGALAMTAMFTAAFETSYGTFVRLAYQKTYDGMLATPLTPRDVFLGEVLWCGCKGAMFTAVVLGVYLVFGGFRGWWPHLQPTMVLVPVVGFCCAMIFASLGLVVTAFIKNLNNFNFFITGALTPMSLFSGMVFPVGDLPHGARELAYALPLFHVTELNRLLLFGPEHCVSFVWVTPIYVLVAVVSLTWIGTSTMERRIVL